MVPVLSLLRFDYGPMRKAEEAIQMIEPAIDANETAADDGARAIVVWLPLLVLGLTLFATLGQLGFPFEQVAGADFRAGLSSAYFFAAVTLVILVTWSGVKKLSDTFNTYIAGMTGMLPIAATLVLAWTLGTVSEQLGTGPYVAELARAGISGGALPAVMFVLAAIISFATGSSWGTIIIMMPLAIPSAIATDASLSVVIGSVLSGGLFGDHSSPVSETTILSSTGAGVTPLQHFSTQLPYALTNGAIAFAGFLVAGYTQIVWIPFLVIGVQIAVIIGLRRGARLTQK
jgi:Na+/H+ antiporter NhaC